VLAKTGTIDFARGLAGYIVLPTGRRLAFAWFANDLDRRVAGRSQQAARAWRNRATALERELLRSWASRWG
jgi:D-alanyl-D-alanine carboxypeptidase/D-alanyl-D-alanine-endopeptidase (penicillin-binding protein 4)